MQPSPRPRLPLRLEDQVHEETISTSVLQPQQERGQRRHHGMTIHSTAKESVEPTVLNLQTGPVRGEFQPLLTEEDQVMRLVCSPDRIAEPPSADRVTQSTEHGHQTVFMNRDDVNARKALSSLRLGRAMEAQGG